MDPFNFKWIFDLKGSSLGRDDASAWATTARQWAMNSSRFLLPFGFLGLQAENLKGCGGAAAHRGDGRTAASIMKAIVQRQSVVGIGAVTTLKGCMDGIDGLPHLIRRLSLPGALGDRHRRAVQQPLVAVGGRCPASWGGVTDNGLRSMHPLGGSRCSDFFEPGQEQPADFLFVGHPFAQRCRDCAGVLALHDLLSLVGIRRFDRLERQRQRPLERNRRRGNGSSGCCNLQPIATILRSREWLWGVCTHIC